MKPRADCIAKVSGFSYNEVGRIASFQRAAEGDKGPHIWINQSDYIH